MALAYLGLALMAPSVLAIVGLAALLAAIELQVRIEVSAQSETSCLSLTTARERDARPGQRAWLYRGLARSASTNGGHATDGKPAGRTDRSAGGCARCYWLIKDR